MEIINIVNKLFQFSRDNKILLTKSLLLTKIEAIGMPEFIVKS